MLIGFLSVREGLKQTHPVKRSQDKEPYPGDGTDAPDRYYEGGPKRLPPYD